MSDRIDLGELERLLKEATPGEWSATEGVDGHDIWLGIRPYAGSYRSEEKIEYQHDLGPDAGEQWERAEGNAAFIVAAHNALPGLLAWVRDAVEVLKKADLALNVEGWIEPADEDLRAYAQEWPESMEAAWVAVEDVLARIAAPSGAPEEPHG